jgi:PAS domain S-box-containing protein
MLGAGNAQGKARSLRHLAKDATPVDVHLSFRPLEYDGRKAVIIVGEEGVEARSAALELARLRERLEAVAANAPVILFAIDKGGRFALGRGRGLKALGVEPGSLRGRSVFEVYAHNPAVIDHVRRALSGEEFTAVVREGGRVFETRYSPRAMGGPDAGVIGVSIDVTEWFEAEQALRTHRAAMEASIDGMAMLGADLSLRFVNGAFLRMHGRRELEDLSGKSWRSLFEPEEARRLESAALPALGSEGVWRGEALGRRKDGTHFNEEITLTRLAGGGALCVAREAGEARLRREEEALRLEMESSGRRKAEAASRQRDEMILGFAEKLRSDLVQLRGWARLLREGNLDAKGRGDAASSVLRRAERLRRFCQTLRQASALAAGNAPSKPEPACAHLALDAARREASAEAEEKSVLLEVRSGEGRPMAFCDPRLLVQALSGLVSRAVDLSCDAGTVRLGVRGDESQVEFSIGFSGKGLPGDGSRAADLGMRAARAFAEACGGSLEEVPSLAGATLSLRLPVPPPPPQAASAASLGGISVLVVDPDEAALEHACGILRGRGAEVRTASSAEQAEAAIRARPPRALVCSMPLAAREGAALIRLASPPLRAAALLESEAPWERCLALRAGFRLHLRKPEGLRRLPGVVAALARESDRSLK